MSQTSQSSTLSPNQATPISSLSLSHPNHQTMQVSTSGVTQHGRAKKDLFLNNLTEISPVSPFIIATSGGSSGESESSGHRFMIPEPSPLLPPMSARTSIAGLFELDPPAERLSSRGNSSNEDDHRTAAPTLASSRPTATSGSSSTTTTHKYETARVDEQEAANILLALSSPESMAPTPSCRAGKGASPPSNFNLDTDLPLDVSSTLTTAAPVSTTKLVPQDASGCIVTEPMVRGESHSVRLSAMPSSGTRGGKLAKSARDFLNLREDGIGFALTHVG